jgi:hypothetical protein
MATTTKKHFDRLASRLAVKIFSCLIKKQKNEKLALPNLHLLVDKNLTETSAKCKF